MRRIFLRPDEAVILSSALSWREGRCFWFAPVPCGAVGRALFAAFAAMRRAFFAAALYRRGLMEGAGLL
ncbi:hypothetical protein QCO44_09610 [Selenomonas sputigena]|uniref:Uncharacterized protein n=1 Tax=Selenomonas sputigena TaxID=69823 RepID=A0ABV3X6S1_9FIRM